MRSTRFLVPTVLAIVVMSSCGGSDGSTDSEAPVSEASTTGATNESSTSASDSTTNSADGPPASEPPISAPAATSTSSTKDDVAPELVLDLPLATTTLNPGEAARLSVGLHCGIGVLDRLVNGRVWRAISFGRGFTPPEWRPDESLPDGPIDVQAVLSEDGEILTLTRNGRSEVYESGGAAFEVDDLCE